MLRSRSARLLILTTLLAAAGGRSIAADVSVDIDREALNRVLTAITATQVRIPLTETRSIAVELRDLRVTALEPDAERRDRGHIRTTVRVVAPELGLDVPMAPRIALGVVEQNGLSLLELRFEELLLQLPFVGAVDLANLLQPMRYPADNVWLLAGVQGDVSVASRLTGIEMHSERLHFEFSIRLP